MTTFRPTSDVSKVGAWANQAAGTTNLYQSVDEAVTDDADYVTISLEGPGILDGQVGSPVAELTANSTPYTYRQMMFGDVSHFHAGLLLIPDSFSFLTPTPLVFHIHGVTGTETQILDPGWEDFVNLAMDAGWAVIALRGGITVNIDGTDENDGKWGNHECRTSFTDIMGWVNSNITLPAEGVGFISYSAGATHVINYIMQAKDDANPVSAIAMADPALSIRDFYGETGPGGKTHIRDAYSLTTPLTVGDAQWVAAIDVPDNGHDPCIVDMVEIPVVPVYMSASYNDTTVTRELHADVFKARLDNVPWGADTDLITTTDNHGSANNIHGQEIFDWIEAAYT